MARVRLQLGEIDVITSGTGQLVFENLDLIAAVSSSSTAPTIEQQLNGPSINDLPVTPPTPTNMHPAPVVVQHSTVDGNARLGRGDLTLKDSVVPGVGYIELAERVSRADEHVAATVATDVGQPSSVAVRRYFRKEKGHVHQYAAAALVAALAERDRLPWKVIWIEEHGGSPIPERFAQWEDYADALLGQDAVAVPVQATLADEPIVQAVQGPPHGVSQRPIDPERAIRTAIAKKGEAKYPADARAATILAIVLLYPLTPELRKDTIKSKIPFGGYKEVWLFPLQQDPICLPQHPGGVDVRVRPR
jgi:hypothetical protein